MTTPNFGNLARFATRCTTFKCDNIIVNKQDAKGIAQEYQRMLAYIVELQNRVIKLQNEINTPQEIEIKSPEF